MPTKTARNIARFIHEKIPVRLQEVSSPFAAILSPFYLRRGGLWFYKYYAGLKKADFWDRDMTEEYQQMMLTRIINHCSYNVPYYKKLFRQEGIRPSSIRCQEDLENIPILTKDVARKNFFSLLSKRLGDIGNPELATTSGTTGKPMRIIKTNKLMGIQQAVHEIDYESVGVPSLLGRTIKGEGIVISDRCGPESRGVFFGKNPEYDPLSRQIILRQYVDNEILDRFAEILKNIRPRYFVGRPLLLYHFAKFAKKKGMEKTFDTAIIMGSAIGECQKMFIEKQFGCKLYNFYRNNEFLSFAKECAERKGLHLSETISITEVLRNGNSVMSKKGKLVSTGLLNYAMPLIRYEVGDITSLSQKKCKCGRCSRVLNGIEGRNDDAVVLSSGKIIFPLELQSALNHEKGIMETQIIQEETNKFVLRLCVDYKISRTDMERIMISLKRIVGSDAKIEFSIEDKIFREGEKPRMVISRVKKEL